METYQLNLLYKELHRASFLELLLYIKLLNETKSQHVFSDKLFSDHLQKATELELAKFLLFKE